PERDVCFARRAGREPALHATELLASLVPRDDAAGRYDERTGEGEQRAGADVRAGEVAVEETGERLHELRRVPEEIAPGDVAHREVGRVRVVRVHRRDGDARAADREHGDRDSREGD